MPNLDLQITLRCNGHCRNCIEFCNMQSATGLDYSDSDMTLKQIDRFVDEMRATGFRFDHVYITGGEPLLHPHVEQIVRRLEPLYEQGQIAHLHINSNLVLAPPPSLAHYIVNFSDLSTKSSIHHTVLAHPSEFGRPRTREHCTHARKHTWVLNYHGFSLCCAGDAYVRLFAMEHMILGHLPLSVGEFPNMDEVCANCPFGNDPALLLERDIGCPVSPQYAAQAAINKAGRSIAKRYAA